MRKGKLAFLVILILSLSLFLSGCGPTNQPPNATFTSNTTNLEVSLDASSSSDADGSIISYSWNLGDGSTASGVSTSHTYDSSGNYSVELTVTDSDGAQDTSTKNISVTAPPNPPTASFTANPTSGEAPLEVSFDASGSSDSDGNIDSYTWDFGDGTTGSGESVTHTFDSSGTYNVELTVTDNDGNLDSTNKSISVDASPPSEDYRVGPKEIIEEFEENEFRAKEKYNGTTVAVTGKIEGFTDTAGNYVYFDGGGWASVYFEFPDSRVDEIIPLNAGDKVTLVGSYDGYSLGSLWFVHSYVE